jgi:hypothetical protein
MVWQPFYVLETTVSVAELDVTHLSKASLS